MALVLSRSLESWSPFLESTRLSTLVPCNLNKEIQEARKENTKQKREKRKVLQSIAKYLCIGRNGDLFQWKVGKQLWWSCGEFEGEQNHLSYIQVVAQGQGMKKSQ